MSALSFDPRLARVVKIKVVESDGEEATIGSGYLVGPGLVLTARHVLWRDGWPETGDFPAAVLRVRTAIGSNSGQSFTVAQAVLLGETSDVDVAVLVVPGLEPVASTKVIGAHFTTTQPVPDCWMIGYPKAGQREQTADAQYVGVSVIPVSGAKTGRISAQVITPPARKDADWRGLSGAGVVDAQNRLLGILVDVQVRWERQLGIIPVRTILKAANQLFADHADLRPLLDLLVAEEGDEVPLFDHTKLPPRLTDLRGDSLFNALQFRNRVVPFIDDGIRGKLVEDTVVWIREVGGQPDLKVAVVTGPAGVGKSRLAAEICDRLRRSDASWQVGFAETSRLSSARVPVMPTVVVCDYPERHPEVVGGFLARIHEQRRISQLQAPVRVLLVARDERSWFDRTRSRCTNLNLLVSHRIRLSLQQFGSHEQAEHASTSFNAFCEGFDIPEHERPDFNLNGHSELDRPLLVHAAALLAAWRQAQPYSDRPSTNAGPAVTNQGQLLDDLINAEVNRLLKLRSDDDSERGQPIFTNTNEVREGLCVITLTTPTRTDLPELLSCTEAFGPHGNPNRVPAADAFLACFPASDELDLVPCDPSLHRIAPVEPDLIAAHLLWRTQGRSKLIERLVSSEPIAHRPDYHAQLIGILALAAEDYPDIAKDLKRHLTTSLSVLISADNQDYVSLPELLAKHLNGLVDASTGAAADGDLTAARVLATALMLPAPDNEHRIDAAATAGLERLPAPNPGLTVLGAALTTRALAYADRASDRNGIARALTSSALWLGGYGQRFEALDALERAIEIYEELAAKNRSMVLPALAKSVYHFAIRLFEVGRRSEAIDALERAVGLFEELVADNRTVHLQGLARSLHKFAIRLFEVGRRSEAIDALERAVGLFEELVADNRTEVLPELAKSSSSLAIRLAGAGRRSEALKAGQRATTLFEGLVAKDRATFLPALAMSMNNLAADLASMGQRTEALQVAYSANMLYEELASSSRPAHLKAMAISMNNFAVRLAEAGLQHEALDVSQRAIECFEELVADDRSVHLARLAYAYWVSAHLREALMVEIRKALEMYDQSIELYEELDETDPYVYNEILSAIKSSRSKLNQALDEKSSFW